MRTDAVPTISRHDYQPYPYRLPQVELFFDLDEKQTRVRTELSFERATAENQPLVLNGQDLVLESVALDGRALAASEYQLNDETLTVFPTAAAFTLSIVSLCRPADNSTLMGLYVSGGNLFTQCEAEGFRRITWFPDRPDVMSRYRVTLRGRQVPLPFAAVQRQPAGKAANCPAARMRRIGKTPTPSPATCSPWWPATSVAANCPPAQPADAMSCFRYTATGVPKAKPPGRWTALRAPSNGMKPASGWNWT